MIKTYKTICGTRRNNIILSTITSCTKNAVFYRPPKVPGPVDAERVPAKKSQDTWTAVETVEERERKNRRKNRCQRQTARVGGAARLMPHNNYNARARPPANRRASDEKTTTARHKNPSTVTSNPIGPLCGASGENAVRIHTISSGLPPGWPPPPPPPPDTNALPATAWTQNS